LPAGLTAREAEVLRHLATGLSNAEIAHLLGLSPRTVNAHLTTIYGKLGVTTRGAAIRFALDHDLQ
jgi:DNA-binding CsgD family transcriptional regulator